MFEVKQYSGQREKDYELVIRQLQALIEDDDDEISVLANVAALLNQFLDEINWVGFYLLKKDELVLGTFLGLPSCTRIAYGIGVCGTSLKEEKTMIDPDVNNFHGHIACDAESQSEIVVPMIINGQRYGVLDVDSPVLERFDNVDQTYLEKFVEILIQHLEKILHD